MSGNKDVEKNQKILFFTSLALIGLGSILVAVDKNTGAGLTFTAGTLILIFSLLSKFKKFKGLGIEAELWEEKQEEAEKLISNLKSLSVVVSKPIGHLVTKLGYWNTALSREELYKIQNNLKDELEKNDISNAMIDEALMEFHLFNLRGLKGPMYSFMQEAIKNEIKKWEEKLRNYPSPVNAGDPDYASLCEDKKKVYEWQDKVRKKFPELSLNNGIDSLQQFIQDFESEPLMNINENLLEKFKDELEDIKYYQGNKEFRRLPEWFASDPIKNK